MSESPNGRNGLRDPFLVSEHSMWRSADIAASSAGLSQIFNRVLMIIAVTACGYGLFAGDKPVAAAGAGLALTHFFNARYSGRREKQFEKTAQNTLLNIASHPLDLRHENVPPPSQPQLDRPQYAAIGQLVKSSYLERSLKYGSLTLDCAAMGGIAIASAHPFMGAGLTVLGIMAARRGFDHLQHSVQPAEKLGMREIRAILKHPELLKYRKKPAPSAE